MVKPIEIKPAVFHGSPEEIEEQLSSFLKDKNLKLYSFVQSQSTVGDKVQVTTTVLYVEYPKEHKEVLGFNSAR